MLVEMEPVSLSILSSTAERVQRQILFNEFRIYFAYILQLLIDIALLLSLVFFAETLLGTAEIDL